MASEEYQIVFTTADSATRTIDGIAASMRELDSVVEKTKPNLSGFAAGAGRSAAAAARQILNLNDEMRSLGTTAEATSGHFQTTGGSLETMAGSMITARAAMFAFRELTEIATAFGQSVFEANEKVEELANKNIKLRETMRELANLQNQPDVNDIVMGNAMLLAVESGIGGFKQSREFMQAFEGAVPAAETAGGILGSVEKGETTKEQQEAFKLEMAKVGMTFAARTGVSPEDAGKLTGLIGVNTKIKTIEDLAGQLNAVEYGLNVGVGKITPLLKSELKIAGELIPSGHIEDYGQAAMLVGVASIARPEMASGTLVRQADELMNTPEGKKGSEYLKRVGATEVKGFVPKLRKIKEDVDKNAGGDVVAYLQDREKGGDFRDAAKVRAMAVMLEAMGTVEERDIVQREKNLGGRAMIAAGEVFKKGRVGTANIGKAGREGMDFVKGAKKEEVVLARQAAENELLADKKIDEQKDLMWDRFAAIPDFFAKQVGGAQNLRERKVNMAMMNRLNREAVRVGVKPIAPEFMDIQHMGDQAKVDREFRSKAAEIRAANGDPGGDNKAVVAGINELVQLEKQKRAERNGVAPPPKPPPGKGAAVPGRP